MTNGAQTAEKSLTFGDVGRLYRPRIFNSTTKQRFIRDRRRRLTQHIGGRPNDVQAIIVDRICAIEWSVCRLHARLDDGELSPHAARELLAFHNHLRLLTRELGMRPAKQRGPSLAKHLAGLPTMSDGEAA